jgi:thiol-disulfide isomerase/thioredoxin
MRKMILSAAVLALVASPVFAGQFNKKVSVGEKAPTFSGIPATTKEGVDSSLSLSDIKEDVVVLVFLANHCPVVQAYEDRIIDFTNDYKNKGVKVVGVAVSDQDIGRAYGATNTPQFFVLDKDRVIKYMGALDDNQNEAKVTKTYLRDAVDAVLKGESPEVSETQPKGCNVKYKR